MNESYSPWVKKLLIAGLYNPGNEPVWADHCLLIHKERRDQLLGSLEREVILEMRDKWIPMAAPYLENPAVSDGDRKKLEKDMHAVKWAGICADRYADYVAQEEWRAKQPQDTQDNPFVPDAPLEGTPASGEDDEARRGPSLEPDFEPAGNEKDLELLFNKVTSQAPQGVEFEVSEKEQSEASEPTTADLVDPAFIRTREQFIAACELANQRIHEAEDIWDLKREIAVSEMYEALAHTARMSKQSELLAKSVRFRAYFKAARLQHTNGQKVFDETEERFMHDLAKLAEEVFEQLLEDGVKNGNLAEKLFRVSGSKSTKATPRNKADDLDPRRFFLSFICDLRANPSFYSPINAGKLLDDPRILENLDPIEEHYVSFSISVIGALRAKRAAQNVLRETNVDK